MLKKILVAVDGSDLSKRALKQAAKMAVSDNAQLMILHAIHPHFLSDTEMDYAQQEFGEQFKRLVGGFFLPHSPVEGSAGAHDFQNYIDAQKKFFQVYGEHILHKAQKMAEETGVKTITLLPEHGEPAKVILATAKKENIDMIVVGRHGHNPIASFFLGSTAKNILQYADRSVLAVD